MFLKASDYYNESKGGKKILKAKNEFLDIDPELLNEVDIYTVQPWVEFVDTINDKIVRIRIVNNGKSPEEMIKHYQIEHNLPVNEVAYSRVRLEIDELGRHRIYFGYVAIDDPKNLPTTLFQNDLIIVDNRKDKNKLPDKIDTHKFSNEDFARITKELSYVCMDTLPLTQITINGELKTCFGLALRADKIGVVYGNKWWLLGGRVKPKGDIKSAGLPIIKRETKLTPNLEQLKYITTNLARYYNPETEEKPSKKTLNVTYSLNLTLQEAAAIELDKNEYGEPEISWIPVDDLLPFLAIGNDYQFDDTISDSYKGYLKFSDKVGKWPIIKKFNNILLNKFDRGHSGVLHTWRLPKYNLNGKKLGDMNISPFDDEYKPLFVVLGQFLLHQNNTSYK